MHGSWLRIDALTYLRDEAMQAIDDGVVVECLPQRLARYFLSGWLLSQ